MKKHFYTVILFISSFTVNAQKNAPEADTEFFNYLKNYKLYNSENIIHEKFKYLGVVTKSNFSNNTRALDFGLSETNYELIIQNAGSYKITEIKDGQEIIAIIAYDQWREILVNFMNTEKVLKLISEHDDYYDGATLSEGIFVRELIANVS